MTSNRISEIASGAVLIDGVDISTLTLDSLRRSIEIIPQVPVLFKGSIRSYMDPFGEYSDEEIWAAIEKTQLEQTLEKLGRGKTESFSPNTELKRITNKERHKERGYWNRLLCTCKKKKRQKDKLSLSQNGHRKISFVNKSTSDYALLASSSSHGGSIEDARYAEEAATEKVDSVAEKISLLTALIEENGNNLSVGERQMLVLSRALLRKASILVMDEATASVDIATDRRIQHVLKDVFSNSTVFTIAHRIETIINYDKIIVMSSGCIVETGTPDELLRRPEGIFQALASDQNANTI